MLLWFAGGAFVIVWQVFQSPALDYRVVVVGALLPLVHAVLGDAGVLDTLLASVALLGIVMVATRGRRLARRRWIGVPIGTMLHLVLDGAWATTRLFWWPLFGADLAGVTPGVLQRSLAMNLLLEALGVAALWWCWRAFGMADAERRRAFWSTGHLDRELLR